MKKQFKSTFSRLIIFSLASLIFTGCEKEEIPSNSINESFGYSTESAVRSSVEIDESGQLERVSLIIPEAFLENLSLNEPAINSPLQYESAKLPIKHLSLKLKQDHGIFSSPHIEVGFHAISIGEKNEIKIEDPLNNVFPTLQLVPANFVPATENLVSAGKRWLNPSAAELHEAEESHTFMIDTYNGSIISFVPVFSVEYLQKAKDQIFHLNIPKGGVQQKGTIYPSSYSLSYEPVKKEYVISLSGFVTI